MRKSFNRLRTAFCKEAPVGVRAIYKSECNNLDLNGLG